MTFVVLDPGFFREKGLNAVDPRDRDAARERLRRRVDDGNRVLNGRRLVGGTDTVPWLKTVYVREVKPLKGLADRELTQALDQMFLERRHAKYTLRDIAVQGQMWGVGMMAGWPALGGSWQSPLQEVLAATVMAAMQEQTDALFLCHRILGRNARHHSANGVELVEVLRWRLTVAIRGATTLVIPCVGKPRHIDVPWTRRLDDRLPDQHGPGLHPYCPPPGWRNSKVTVHRTAQSRPCWVDSGDQHWARPSTGGGHHWDVYLNQSQQSRIGLSQVNVTQHGAPIDEGRPGDLHHVPSNKRHALKNTSGWTCPP